MRGGRIGNYKSIQFPYYNRQISRHSFLLYLPEYSIITTIVHTYDGMEWKEMPTFNIKWAPCTGVLLARLRLQLLALAGWGDQERPKVSGRTQHNTTQHHPPYYLLFVIWDTFILY